MYPGSGLASWLPGRLLGLSLIPERGMSITSLSPRLWPLYWYPLDAVEEIVLVRLGANTEEFDHADEDVEALEA